VALFDRDLQRGWSPTQIRTNAKLPDETTITMPPDPLPEKELRTPPFRAGGARGDDGVVPQRIGVPEGC
jgi:hypothetical protein